MKSNWKSRRPAEAGRPLWGFCRVQVESVCRLWSAYHEKKLQRQDVQVWFATHELQSRRCTLKPNRIPSYSEHELEPLTGLRPPAIRASIRRLERSGFLSWSTQRVLSESG